ncbi:MAG: tetratricopeptide repeat protein, partial [Lentisphaerae bacterium]|nr:tetratricopeptide repeat protein [Lentisphaerota bacterium]
DPNRTFVEAAKAYDDNQLADAIAGWQSLLDAGHIQPAVLYNLGNAHFRAGHLGQAIRAYRHAQTLAPRDPDIRANLTFAAQTAGITLPHRPPPLALLHNASRAEWRALAHAAYWILALLLAARLLLPRQRTILRPAIILALLLLLLSLAGLTAHHRLQHRPELVVIPPGQTLLSAPLPTATPLLDLPQGAIVRQRGQRDTWLEIQYQSTRGWLPATATAPTR